MLTRRALWTLVSAVPLLPVAACRSPVATPPSPVAAAAVVSDRLFFGRNIPAGGTVSDSAWAVFLAEAVTPRFPDGFTVWRTEGQWRGADGRIEREAGFVLEVDHPAGQPPDSTLANIALEYCRRFQQEAVLHVRAPAQQWLYRASVR